MKQKKPIPVSARAIVQRIKRALAKRGLKLVACRDGSCLFYVTDGRCADQWHRLDMLAENNGVLKPWESIQ